MSEWTYKCEKNATNSIKQEILHILSIGVTEVRQDCTRSLKFSNIDVQQDYLSKTELIWLLFEVPFISFSVRETSRLYLCFIIK